MAISSAKSVHDFNRNSTSHSPLNENNPLVQRFQETLRKHLLKHREKLIFDRQELNKKLKSTQSEREELGCKLHNVQEKLACYTTKLQTLTAQYAELESRRPEIEVHLAKAKERLTQATEEFHENKSQEVVLLHNEDLLNKQVYHLELSKEMHKSDVVVLRHATKKAVTECSRLEIDKRKQEAHISRLASSIQKLQEKICSHEAQTKTIYEEVNQIRESLSKARMEADTIRLEGKNLMDHWNSSLGKMQTRDETLSYLQETFITQQDQFQLCQSEIRSLEKSVTKEETMAATLSSILKNLSTDIDSLTKQLTLSFEKQEAFRLEMTSLKCQLQKLQSSIDEQKNIKTWKDAELKDVTKSLQSIILEKDKLHHALNEKILTSNWVDKSIVDIAKTIQIIQEDEKKLDDIKSKEQAEYLRLQLENAKNKAHIEQLKEDLEYYQTEILVKEKEIKERELSSKKCIVTIDKNQKITNQLRYTLEATDHQGSETGPMELQLNNMQRCLEQIQIESHNLQTTWLKQQRNLMKLSQEKDAHMAKTRHLERQFNIYGQRKLRLENEIQRAESDCNHLNKTLNNLHKRISLMNKQMYEEQSEENNLCHLTILTEEDLFRSLSNAENELIALKDHLDFLKDEDEKLSQKLLDAESDLLQWQGKFHITKEVKSSTESEYKKGEIYELQHNLHKMQVQYSGICRQHGRLAQKMEQAVNRWDVLLTKGEIQMATGSVGTMTAPLKRHIEVMKKRILSSEKEIEELERKINTIVLQYDILNQEINAKGRTNGQMQSMLVSIDNEAKGLNCERMQNFEVLVVKQHQSQHHQNILDSKYQSLCHSPEVLKSEMEKHKLWSVKLNEVLKKTIQNFPDLVNELEPILLQQMWRMRVLEIET